MNTYKKWAIGAVLIIGLLATVATSPAPDFRVTEQQGMNFTGPTTVRVVAQFTTESFAHADSFGLDLQLLAASGGPFTVSAIPDDPALEPRVADATANGNVISFFDVLPDCTGNAICEFGVSVDIPADAGLRLEATATLTAQADSSFFFPEDRDFPPGTTIELTFDDASVGP